MYKCVDIQVFIRRHLCSGKDLMDFVLKELSNVKYLYE